MMSEEDKIRKIIDALPPAWSKPGYDPHKAFSGLNGGVAGIGRRVREIDAGLDRKECVKHTRRNVD